MSNVDTSTWNPDPALNESIGDIPLNESASIEQTWQAIQMLMAALKGDTSDIKLTINQPDGTTIVATNQTLTVVDNGHAHTIANVAGLQTVLDGKAADVDMQGATASVDGASGLVPKPLAGDQDKVLKGDGTWSALSASDIPNVDASAITSGTIDIARLPAGSLERLVSVTDQTARFALTTDAVQLGDTVKQLDTGLLYFVTDTAHLDSESGYEIYTAGAASAVPWSGVTDKPSTFPPSSHTHGSITNDGRLGTASRVVVTDGSKVIGVSSVTSTELGYLSGVTSAVQTQISGKVSKSGDTMTGALNGRASNVNLAVEPSSVKEDWRFYITRNSADTTHTGNLLRLGIVQSANTKDYRIMLGVSNPRAGNLPTQESITGGEDDSDARTSNCWGGIGVYYDYSKNRAYPYCYDLSTCDPSDNSTTYLATNRWVRTATGDFACNAATATSAASAIKLFPQPNTSMPTGNLTEDGLQLVEVTLSNTGYPCYHGNVLNAQGSVKKGAGQLLLGWSGNTNGIEHLYYRNKRDAASTWSDWKTIAFTSDDITGNAATATKLATARTISLGDFELSGSASFDGSSNILLNATPCCSIVSVGNRNNYPYHRIGFIPTETGQAIDKTVTLLVCRDFNGGGAGICRIEFRTNSATQNANCSVRWLVRTDGLPLNSIQVGFVSTPGAAYFDVFYKSEGAWCSATFRILACSDGRASVGRGISMISKSSETSNTTESNPGGSVESYASISAAGTALHNAAYTAEITASDAGVVSVAATVQTPSDERMKTPISAVPDEVLDAWEAVNWGQFQYLDALEEKGEDARVHLGLIAQRVDAVFSERGLDACGYGILCRDEASGFWTIRYAEALVLEAVCQRRRADRLEARIAALEEAMNA